MAPRKMSETSNIPNGITVEVHVVGPGGQARHFTGALSSEYKAKAQVLVVEAKPGESLRDMVAAILAAIVDAMVRADAASQVVERPPAMSRREAADLLCRAILDLGLRTVRAAANVLGISETHLLRLLKAQRRITEEMDAKLALKLGRPNGSWVTT